MTNIKHETSKTASLPIPYDEVLEIIRATNDGDDLSPTDLTLTELAINGRLNERGLKRLVDLLARVRAGYRRVSA